MMRVLRLLEPLECRLTADDDLPTDRQRGGDGKTIAIKSTSPSPTTRKATGPTSSIGTRTSSRRSPLSSFINEAQTPANGMIFNSVKERKK